MKTTSLTRLIFVMLVVACGSAALLGFVYEITKAPIQKANDDKELAAISGVILEEFNNNPFKERTLIPGKHNQGQLTLYPARKDGKIKAVAIKTSSDKAFGGKIELIVGFFLDGTISGYQIISSKETPGLGSKVSDAKFSEQFIGIRPKKKTFKVKQDGGEIDAVTAATISSRAVIDAIQKAYDAYHKFSTRM